MVSVPSFFENEKEVSDVGKEVIYTQDTRGFTVKV